MPRPKPVASLRPDERRGRRRWVVVFILVALLLASGKACSAMTGRSNPLDRTLTAITSPLVYVIRRTGEGLVSLKDVFRVPSLRRENARLTTDNLTLQQQTGELELIKQENQRLRDLLKLSRNAPGDYKGVPAEVTARPYDLWLDSALIDAGRRDGILEGNLVVNEFGVVGVVSETQENTSRITLISSPQFALGAISCLSRDEGVVRGVTADELQMKGVLLFDWLPSGATIAVGEKVYTRGDQNVPNLAGSRPRGLLIGTVTERVADRSGYLRITLTPAANINRLGRVLVYTK